jgi:hypothetical protein
VELAEPGWISRLQAYGSNSRLEIAAARFEVERWLKLKLGEAAATSVSSDLRDLRSDASVSG